MNEHSYLTTQEHITRQALDAIARSRDAATPGEKLEHWQTYLNLCQAACGLRMAYHKTLRVLQAQRRALAA